MSGKSKTKKAQKVREAKDVRDAMSETSTSAQAAEDFLLPDAGVVMIDGASKDDKTEAKSLPAAVTSKPISQKSAAEWAYERLILYIQNFEEQLDPEQEVVMGFTGGDVGTMRIEGMGYFAPDMVTFYGTDDNGIKTQMMQHVSQLKRHECRSDSSVRFS